MRTWHAPGKYTCLDTHGSKTEECLPRRKQSPKEKLKQIANVTDVHKFLYSSKCRIVLNFKLDLVKQSCFSTVEHQVNSSVNYLIIYYLVVFISIRNKYLPPKKESKCREKREWNELKNSCKETGELQQRVLLIAVSSGERSPIGTAYKSTARREFSAVRLRCKCLSTARAALLICKILISLLRFSFKILFSFLFFLLV